MPPGSTIAVPEPVIVPPDQVIRLLSRTDAGPPSVPVPVKVKLSIRDSRSTSVSSNDPPSIVSGSTLSRLATVCVPTDSVIVGVPATSMQTSSPGWGSPSGAQFAASTQLVPSPPPSQLRSGFGAQKISADVVPGGSA